MYPTSPESDTMGVKVVGPHIDYEAQHTPLSLTKQYVTKQYDGSGNGGVVWWGLVVLRKRGKWEEEKELPTPQSDSSH